MPKESTKATITSFAGTPLVRVVDGSNSRNISPANLVAESGAQTALDGRYAPLQTKVRAGRKWLFAGDSITNGSAASNFIYSYTRLASGMAGHLYIAADSIEAGTSGYNAAELDAAIDDWLDTYNPDAVHIQIGTNDSGQSVTLASYSASVESIVRKCRIANAVVTLGTVPPRTSGSASLAASRPFIAAYNLWLRQYAAAEGIELADMHAVLCDQVNGDGLSSYFDADGLHPNNLGHIKMAQELADTALRCFSTRPPHLVDGVNPLNLVANPLIDTVAGSGDAAETIGGASSGTSSTRSSVADTSGVLRAGFWAQIEIDAATNSYYGRNFNIDESAVATDDVVVATGMIQIVDVDNSDGSGWEAACAAGTGYVDLALFRDAVNLGNTVPRNPGRHIGNGVFVLGPVFFPFTPGSSFTALLLRYGVAVPSGLHIQARFGEVGLFNATDLAVDVGSSSFTNIDGA